MCEKERRGERFVLGLLVDSSVRLPSTPSRPCLRRGDIRWSVKDVYVCIYERGRLRVVAGKVSTR
ncbi:hypothetical protein WN55_08857 [Dufourea novaeangliae]|uniref:Uncharacterized protein n=1 Tax=Dufourea novaeangliae TaxID=178035 RepID=A0A154P297_DUFNO|nr:hypothetical protein WN55_08857 [Dufourea novaeangliae]